MINEKLNKRRFKIFNKRSFSSKVAMIKRYEKKFKNKKKTEHDQKFLTKAKAKIIQMVE